MDYKHIIFDSDITEELLQDLGVDFFDKISKKCVISTIGEAKFLHDYVSKSGGYFFKKPSMNSKQDINVKVRNGLDEYADIYKQISNEKNLRKSVLHIKKTDDICISDILDIYNYSEDEFIQKKDCYLRLNAHGFENCPHGCAYCYANYDNSRPTILLYNSINKVKSYLQQEKYSNLVKAGFPINIGSITDLGCIASLELGILNKFLLALNGIRVIFVTKSPNFVDYDETMKIMLKQHNVQIVFTYTNLFELEYNLPYKSNIFPADKLSKVINSGLSVDIFYNPVIPGYNDSEESFENVVKIAKSIGVNSICVGFIRINKRIINSIDQCSNKLSRHLKNICVDEYDGDFYPEYKYRLDKIISFRKIADKYNLPFSLCRPNIGLNRDAIETTNCICRRKDNLISSEVLQDDTYSNC